MRTRAFWVSIALAAMGAFWADAPVRAFECPAGCTCTFVCPDVPATPEPAEAAAFNVVINEFLPDPEGDDAAGEFVELLNLEAVPADLYGWTLKIGTKSFSLNGTVLPAGGFRFFPYAETKGFLSNSGQTVEILNGAGESVQTVAYPKAPTGKAYARRPVGGFEWTPFPTPGSANVFEAVQDSADEADTETKNPQADGEGATIDGPEASVEETAANDPESPPVPDGEADVILSEFLPDPEGSDDHEWIEIRNRESRTVSLNGWVLDDSEGGSQPFPLNGLTVPANGFLLVWKAESRISLNNGGDEVRLFRPDGTPADAIAYKTAPVGKSFARSDSGWFWTDRPTPGEANGEPETPISDGSGGEDGAYSEEEAVFSIAELPDLENGTLVSFAGTVSLPLDVLGKTILMAEDQAAGAGAELRLYGPERPELMYGQHLLVTGRISQTESGWRVNVSKGGLTVLEGQTPPVPLLLEPGQIGPEHHGMTVSVEATVVSKSGRLIRFTDRSGEPQLAARIMGKDPIPGQTGDEMTLTGVIRWKGEGGELAVPDRSGVRLKPPETDEPEPDGRPDEAPGLHGPLADGNRRSAGWPLAVGGAGTAGLAAAGIVTRRRIQGQPDAPKGGQKTS